MLFNKEIGRKADNKSKIVLLLLHAVMFYVA